MGKRRRAQSPPEGDVLLETSSGAMASEAEPDPELAERAQRVMCVFTNLADSVVADAWKRCRTPDDVRATVSAAAHWEAWVTCMRLDCKRSFEVYMMQHALTMTRLRELDVGWYEPTRRRVPAPVSACARVIQRCPQLTYLDLSGIEIDEARMVELYPGLATLSRLTTLKLDGNPLGAAGSQWLARTLTHTRELTYLSVTGSLLDEDAMATLEPSLSGLSQLQELLLGSNPLGDRGAECLARALTHMPALTDLSMFDTELQASAAAAIRAAVPRGCSVLFDCGWETIS